MVCNSMHLSFSLCIYLFVLAGFSFQLSCKNEANDDVDWFINYKLPKIDSEPAGSLLYEGKAYAHLTSRNPRSWILSTVSVESPSSMLGRTWKEFREQMKNSALGYLFYNDDSPENFDGTAAGHLKGMIAFDDRSGFWIRHSIPRFGEATKYEYPESGLVNGQIAICVTFRTSSLSEICTHLLYCHPNIYNKGIHPSILGTLDDQAKTLFSNKPSFIRKSPFSKISNLTSLGKRRFMVISKDNQFSIDFYSSLLAVSLKTSLLAQTWRRGSGRPLDPFCREDYSVTNIESINMTTTTKRKGVYFRSGEDHSKWAISMDQSRPWVCIGDLNRMASQRRRGGGAICYQSKPVWKAFLSIINESGLCPT